MGSLLKIGQPILRSAGKWKLLWKKHAAIHVNHPFTGHFNSFVSFVSLPEGIHEHASNHVIGTHFIHHPSTSMTNPYSNCSDAYFRSWFVWIISSHVHTYVYIYMYIYIFMYIYIHMYMTPTYVSISLLSYLIYICMFVCCNAHVRMEKYRSPDALVGLVSGWTTQACEESSHLFDILLGILIFQTFTWHSKMPYMDIEGTSCRYCMEPARAAVFADCCAAANVDLGCRGATSAGSHCDYPSNISPIISAWWFQPLQIWVSQECYSILFTKHMGN